MKNILACILLAGAFNLAPAAEAIPQYSVELSGSAAVKASYFDNAPVTTSFVFQPGVNFYLTPAFFLGPLVSYNHSGETDVSFSTISYGAQLGYIFMQDLLFLPYFGGGAGSVNYINKYDDPTVADESSSGYSITAFAGAKFPLGGRFFLNIQPTYTRTVVNGSKGNSWDILLGFSGMVGGR